MVRGEIILGLLAAISWSLHVILLKAASKSVPLGASNVLMSTGILISALITYLLLCRQEVINFNTIYLLPFLAGVLWFCGIFVVNYGIKKGLNLSIMAPIYNLNTLLVVLLSLVIFKENVVAWKVIVASILVTIAAILLS
ncbi:MAG TPA: hypothetical protein EYH22_02155 [Candidatus Nanopusillus sp.]|nr:hypothetical protein [Candidatus Nanopusillus sp.]